MKLPQLILLLCLMQLSAISFASGFKTFIPKDNGYAPVAIELEQPSINNICEFLGYNPDQFYTYHDSEIKNSKVAIVVFKVFTSQIIGILTEESVETITSNDVSKYLINFNIKDDFDSYTIVSTLEDGIKNQSLTEKFLREIFNYPSPLNGSSLIAMEIGYELHFTNGILSGFNPSDGLNKWAKMWKNEMPDLYKKYYNEAAKYNQNEKDILFEVNAQADAFASVPNGVMNEFIKSHTNNNGLVNYSMLLLTHYGKAINQTEFEILNKGRYEVITGGIDQSVINTTTYQVNKGQYTFNEKGELMKATLTE